MEVVTKSIWQTWVWTLSFLYFPNPQITTGTKALYGKGSFPWNFRRQVPQDVVNSLCPFLPTFLPFPTLTHSRPLWLTMSTVQFPRFFPWVVSSFTVWVKPLIKPYSSAYDFLYSSRIESLLHSISETYKKCLWKVLNYELLLCATC